MSNSLKLGAARQAGYASQEGAISIGCGPGVYVRQRTEIVRDYRLMVDLTQTLPDAFPPVSRFRDRRQVQTSARANARRSYVTMPHTVREFLTTGAQTYGDHGDRPLIASPATTEKHVDTQHQRKKVGQDNHAWVPH